MSLTRRSLLHLMGGTVAGVLGGDMQPLNAAPLPHPSGGRLGLELYSLRNELKADVPGTLKTVRAWGFEEVELAGFPPMSAADAARMLKTAGLRAVSAFNDYERYRDDFAGVVRDARTLGLEYVICGWIPHDNALTKADAERAIGVFNRWGSAAVESGLRFAYHVHGFEFQPDAGGTLLDTMLARTDPRHVDYEMDVFWVVRGGGNPVALLGKYGSRFRLAHLKDMRRGTETGVLTGEAPLDTNVVLGTGSIDWPAVLRAATTARVKWYFIEDEHPDAMKQIPRSLDYLRRIKP